jgi:pimeloyl-ACP methyl ester carboxylesterase
MALERCNPKRSRRACSPRFGLQSCRGKSAGVAKRPHERIFHPKPLTLRFACIAAPGSLLLVAGALDPKFVRTSRQMAAAHAACHPNTTSRLQVAVVAGAGHALHEERAEALVPLVRRFAAVGESGAAGDARL